MKQLFLNIFTVLLNWVLIYDAVIGKWWSWSPYVLIALVWFVLFCNFLCMLSNTGIATIRASTAKLNKPIVFTVRFAFIAFMFYHQWYMTAIALIISSLIEFCIFYSKEKTV